MEMHLPYNETEFSDVARYHTYICSGCQNSADRYDEYVREDIIVKFIILRMNSLTGSKVKIYVSLIYRVILNFF